VLKGGGPEGVACSCALHGQGSHPKPTTVSSSRPCCPSPSPSFRMNVRSNRFHPPRGGPTRRVMRLATALGAVVITGCQARAPTPEPRQCGPRVPSGAHHPIASRAASLAGDYELIQVRSQPDAGAFTAGRLHLEPLDSTARAGAVGGAVRDLVGWLEPHDDDPARKAELADRAHPSVVLAGDHVVLGRAGTLDGYVEHLTITAVAPEGFWGWWRAERGLQAPAAAEGGRALPDPAGYFCALRVPS
jgi:hypothetical protein